MREFDENRPFAWWKKRLEKQGYTVEETVDEINVRYDDNSYVKFFKKSMEYTAVGFGSPLMFTTYPMYEDWRGLIKAWIRSQQGWKEG